MLVTATGPRMRAILLAGAMPAIVHQSAYANTLTALIPQIYAAMDVVSRELTGFIPSSMRAPGVERAAVGQSVAYPIAPPQAAYDVVPAMNVPEPPDNAFTTGFMAITKSRAVPFGFTGEEQQGLNSGGIGGVNYLTAQGMLIAQALRTLANEIETDLAAEATANASRAYGNSGTTPFDPTTTAPLRDLAFTRKILDDNGAPVGDRSIVINTASGANLRSVNNLIRVNEAGTQMTLRQGELLDIHGMSVKETGQSVYHVKGTSANSTTNGAAYATGATVITLAAAGTGSILPGDVVQFAGDANKYVVIPNGGDADTSNGGTFTIAAPGLRVAIPAATAITVLGSYAANVAFSQSALHIAMRPPATPVEGDLALDRMLVTDPRSGITFEISIWPGYRKVRAEVALAWGVKATKREHIALLLG